MRKIRLTETTFRNMLTEMVKEVLLLEADRRVERARNGCASYLKNFGDIKSAFRKFREDFYGEGLMGNDNLETLQLAPMFCKFAVEKGWTPTTGTDDITEVKKILFEIVIHHKEDIPELVNEFNNNPNEITWSFIHDKYQPFIDKRQEQENARISQNQYTKDNRYNYQIYGPLNFEQAKEFGDYSYPNSKICYTQNENTWSSSSYTANNTRKVYVLVLSNWKDIPCEHTSDGYITQQIDGKLIPVDNNGYDLYGMSMIFLIVDKLGNLVVSNTRWNHGGLGREPNIDHMFTKEDIYKLIGSKADEIFNTSYQNIQDALNKGVSIEELFDEWVDIGNGYIKVCIGNKWTILDNNKQILYKPNNPEQWFDSIYKFDSNGIAVVKLNGKQTWFSLEKQDYLFQDKWFQWVDEFDDNGIAPVKLNDKWNWFSLEKQDYLFPNLWFDSVDEFDDNGIAPVKLNDKWNWFSLEKQDYLFPNQWFDRVDDFDDNGIARVRLNDKWNWFSLEKQGLLSPNQWFEWVYDFDDNGIAVVVLNGKQTWFSLKKQDYLFPNQWFNSVGEFYSNGIARVRLNDKYYEFTLDGQLLDIKTQQPLSQEEVQELFQQQQQIDEMVNMLVRNYLR